MKTRPRDLLAHEPLNSLVVYVMDNLPLPLFRGVCSGRVPLVIDNMPSPQRGIWYTLEILKSEV